MKKKRKKAQVTIFIIIGIVIIGFGVLIYAFYPQIKSAFGFEEKDPYSFMQSCLEDELKNIVKTISLQGGSLEPNFYFTYKGEKIEYLCYAESYYKTCVIQQPMLKRHIESEIKKEIKEEVNACFDDLKKSFEKRAYDVVLEENDFSVELLPEKIIILSNNSLFLKKDESKEYKSFKIFINNNLYETVSIVNSILEWETRYGDAETTSYMDYYPNLKVEKKKQSEGTTIYILTNRKTQDKFQFASRSIAWPPGYETGGVY